jgi:hypothetical protein
MPHADAVPMSVKVGATLQRANDLGIISDSFVNANHANVAAFQTAVQAVTPAHADQGNYRRRIAQAVGADGGITDAAIASVSTVAGLLALTSIGSLANRDLYGD